MVQMAWPIRYYPEQVQSAWPIRYSLLLPAQSVIPIRCWLPLQHPTVQDKHPLLSPSR